jgi:hypothetical protein
MNRKEKEMNRILPLFMMFCLLPAMAQASWTLNTWAKSGGGVISSRNNATQTSVNGSVFKSYTTHASLPVITNTAIITAYITFFIGRSSISILPPKLNIYIYEYMSICLLF